MPRPKGRPLLTKRQRQVLEIMAKHQDEDEGELVYERGKVYIGDDPIAPRTFYALLRLMAISLVEGTVGQSVERYRINETGRGFLK